MATSLAALDQKFVDTSTVIDETINNAELKTNLALRKNKRISTANTVVYVARNISNLTTLEKTNKIKKLNILSSELNELDNKVLSSGLACKHYTLKDISIQGQIAENYQDKIIDTVSFLESSLNDSNPSNVNFVTRDNNSSNFRQTQSKLPCVTLPYFEGDRSQYLNFISTFENALIDRNLSSYDKFLYLRGQLKGSARQLVERLPYREDAYEFAKNLLEKAFCNPIDQKFAVIKQLMDLKYNGSHDLEWFSIASSLYQQISDIDLNIEVVCQYFFWESLPTKIQNLFINVTSKAKPSVKDIFDNFLDISQRHREMQEKFDKGKTISKQFNQNFSKERNYTSFAANVNINSSLKMCRLCKPLREDSQFHSISRCMKYQTAKQKLDRLKELNCCTKCSSDSHLIRECKTKLNTPCRFCSRDHLYILCLKGDRPTESTIAAQAKNRIEISSGIVWSDTFHVNLGKNIVLPTFTIDAIGLNENTIPVFGLFDSGSQGTFIAQSVLPSINYKVLRDQIELNISGINLRKSFTTKEILLQVNIGNHYFDVKAIVLPSIPTHISWEGYSVVLNGFQQKGYKLANSKENVDAIDLIFGMNSIDLFDLKTVKFGAVNDKSTYFDTTLGVMLVGDVSIMISNLEYLQKSTESPTRDTRNKNSGILPISEKIGKVNKDHFGTNDHPIHASMINCLVDQDDNIIEKELDNATNDALARYKSSVLDIEVEDGVCSLSKENEKLFTFLLDNIKRDAKTNKFIVPLLWNPNTKHLLPNNFNLSFKILQSNIKRLRKDPHKLKQYDDVLKNQLKLGIVEKITDTKQFLATHDENTLSFLGHMAVFRNKETSPCRIVFLSNVGERGISHNLCLKSGCNLNETILKVLCSLRHGKFLTICDVEKAFLNLLMKEIDQNKLLFLWYDDVLQNCENLVIYRPKTIIFGLPNSPISLMACLYKHLIYDAEDDSDDLRQLKREIYSLSYMDNIAVTAESGGGMLERYHLTIKIFQQCGLSLQQFATNCLELQQQINETDLCENQETSDTAVVPLLGILWNTKLDTFSIKPYCLSITANTKRSILATVHKIWDVLGIQLPVLNKCKLFLNEILQNKDLSWDKKLDNSLILKWKSVCKIINKTVPRDIPRFVGTATDHYDLIVFTDASRVLIGCVCYIKNKRTNVINILCAKNKIVGKNLIKKSTAILEVLGVEMGVKLLIDLYKNYTNSVHKINIDNLILFTDSTISISWLALVNYRLDALKKKSVLLKNRLNNIGDLCKVHSIKFCHVAGNENAADCTTRCLSNKALEKSRFYEGPVLIRKSNYIDNESVIIIPCLVGNKPKEKLMSCVIAIDSGKNVFPLERYSSFHKAATVLKNVLKVCNRFKLNIISKNLDKFKHLKTVGENTNLFCKATKLLIRNAQMKNYSNVFNYFNNIVITRKLIPPIVSQLNLFVDDDGIIRVKSKMGKLNASFDEKFPMLLSPKCPITLAIINDFHQMTCHGGLFNMISQLRRQFWIVNYLSTIKRVLKRCAICSKMNARTIQVNQNDFRHFRINPNQKSPFAYSSMDYIGPYEVNLEGRRVKVYLLLFTDLYSRAINLILCRHLTTENFLRALQMHSYSYGFPVFLLSDAGSQMVAGMKILEDFYNDPEVQEFLNEHGIQELKHEVIPSKASFLNGITESLVKQVKLLINKSLRNNILNYFDFDLHICNVIYLINSRPVGFKETMHSDVDGWVITPNLLIKGYDPMVLNTIPNTLNANPDLDIDDLWTDDANVRNKRYNKHLTKLRKTKQLLNDSYYKEFLTNLEKLSSNNPKRYLAKHHIKLEPGDIVAIVLPNCKRAKYPLAIVEDIITNSIGEVTAAYLRKSNRERVHFHVSNLILIIKNRYTPNELESFYGRDSDIGHGVSNDKNILNTINRTTAVRKAAKIGRQKTHHLISSGLI